VAPSPEWRARLAALLGAARAVWPDVRVSDEAFSAHVAARLGEDADLETLPIADLLLACGCALGEPRALALFERHFLLPARAALSRFEAAGVVDDALQNVRARLLVTEGGAPPRIADFAGQGSLEGWVKVAALRAAIDLTRRDRRESSTDDEDLAAAEAALAPEAHPELEYLKAEYREPFAAAVRAAVVALSRDERSLLRFNLVDGLNIAAIGAIYGVHRATVARWIAQARAHVLEATRTELRARLGIADDELDSLIQALASQLDVSLHGLLRSSTGA
jgi:RNA polymerase sigma-70 factor, ECF subfamily